MALCFNGPVQRSFRLVYQGEGLYSVALPQTMATQTLGALSLSQAAQDSFAYQDNLIAQFLGPVTLQFQANLTPPPVGDLSFLAHDVEQLDFDSPEELCLQLSSTLLMQEMVHRAVRGLWADGNPHTWLEVWHAGRWQTLDPWAYLALKREPGALLRFNSGWPAEHYLGSHEGARLALAFGPVEVTHPIAETGSPVLERWLPWTRGLAVIFLISAAIGLPPYPPAALGVYGLYLLLLAGLQGAGWWRLFKHNPARAFEPLFLHGFALSALGTANAGLGLGWVALFVWHRWPKNPSKKPQTAPD